MVSSSQPVSHFHRPDQANATASSTVPAVAAVAVDGTPVDWPTAACLWVKSGPRLCRIACVHSTVRDSPACCSWDRTAVSAGRLPHLPTAVVAAADQQVMDTLHTLAVYCPRMQGRCLADCLDAMTDRQMAPNDCKFMYKLRNKQQTYLSADLGARVHFSSK
jgi:hypothetical protein